MIKVPLHGIVKNDTEIGAGDVVKRITDALHIRMENCNCSVRQQRWNQALVFTGKSSYMRRDRP